VIATFFMLRWNRYGLSGGICGSCSAFRCVCGVKRDRTNFHAHVGPVRIRKKRVRARYVELVLFNPVDSMGHVVHSGASRT
jgi:hypothetical protein